mgnify:CR=1 FL=1
MNAITRALKAAYNFFAGDAIILSTVIGAFIAGYVLARRMHAPNVLVAVVFIALIVGGLATTLGRELAGRPRTR